MARYGVTANAIAPAARTRMTEEVFADRMARTRRRLRRQRPRQHLAARRVARQRRLARRHRPRVRGRGRHDLGRRRLAARPAARQGRALGARRARCRGARAAREGARRPRRSTARSDARPRDPAPPRGAGASWRGARRAWTDETLLDRLATRRRRARSRSSTATCALTVDDLRARSRSRRGARCASRGRRPGRRRRVAAAELVGSGRAVLGDLALRRDREPDHADACGPARSASSSTRPARASSSCRTTFRGTDYAALLRDDRLRRRA